MPRRPAGTRGLRGCNPDCSTHTPDAGPQEPPTVPDNAAHLARPRVSPADGRANPVAAARPTRARAAGDSISYPLYCSFGT